MADKSIAEDIRLVKRRLELVEGYLPIAKEARGALSELVARASEDITCYLDVEGPELESLRLPLEDAKEADRSYPYTHPTLQEYVEGYNEHIDSALSYLKQADDKAEEIHGSLTSALAGLDGLLSLLRYREGVSSSYLSKLQRDYPAAFSNQAQQ
ncbi:MAG: hypothetical protein KKC75_05160 [Nanoarchaeota archaeon]|nr:hypothetical protein [Nanoarchaeota archaeon]MBU1004843.1 hypothetical protein [Nanoarchaeota archaeon]MBU1946781.1 hypothetical protein [Nanoarchaeota archaeon]